MSDTESFESVYERLYPQLHNPCGLWKAATIAEWLDDLERAHNREIRDVAQQQYHRGYGDGAHSMDAEHRAIAMRLRGIRFDGGSHENLSQIARAIWHNDFGWTQDACMGLRDELVRLMGGVSDDTCGAGCGCAAADCDGRDSVEQAEVSDDCVDCDILGPDARGHAVDCDFHELGVSDGGTADDSAADFCGRTGCDVVHLDGLVAYDVLDNERRKAIAELRNMKIDSSYYGNYRKIALAIGTVYDGESFVSECVRDRLVYLLGGDRPSGIDELRDMDELEVDGRITDELREWASDRHCKGMSHTDVLNIGLIADRIDEQFNRICQQQEAVLQSTIDSMCEEQDKLQKRLRTAELGCDANHRLAEANARWCDELVDLLRDAAADFKNASYGWDYAVIVGENITLETKCKELQAKLDAIRDALDG